MMFCKFLTRMCTALIVATVSLTACSPDKNSLVLDENAPMQTMKNATIQHTESGKLRMIMWGAEIQNFDDEDQTQEFPKHVKATFYSEEGQITTVITADEGTNIQKKKLMNLRKNVIIKDLRNGTTTYTEDFFWNQETRRIYSKVPVLRVDKNGSRYRGSGFESDDEMQDFNLFNMRLDINMN